MAKKIAQTSKRPMTVGEWLTSNLDMHGKTNRELGEYLNVFPTLISAWKNNSQKMPFHHCIPIAKFFGADPLYLRNLMMENYYPGLFDTDERIRMLGSITSAELEFLNILRENPVANVEMNDEEKEEFRRFVAKLRDNRGLKADSPDTMVFEVGMGAHKGRIYNSEEERQKAEKLRLKRQKQQC